MKTHINKFRKNKHIDRVVGAWTKLHTLAAFFAILFFILGGRLFGYTVIEGKYYADIAYKQQVGEVIVPVNRGGIYSSVERAGELQRSSAFATSINLYNVAIDPQMEGDKQKLGEFLIDFVYTELCAKEEYCEDDLRRFLKLDEFEEEFIYDETYIKDLLGDNIFKRLAQTRVTSVLIDHELTEEQIEKITQANLPGVYPTETMIYVNPEEFQEKNVGKLANMMGMIDGRLERLVRKRDLRYIPILQKISISGSEELKNFLAEEKAALRRGLVHEEESISKFFILEPEASRYYPESKIASQIIGFVDNAGVGHYGIEGYYNEYLKGNSGKVLSTKDVHGRVIDPQSFDASAGTEKGVQIVTTIDRNIQKKVEEIIKKGVINFRATKGTIVVMEPKTGRIISMANYPSYDINNYGNVYEMEKINNDDFENPEIDLLGYPIFVEDSTEGKPVMFDGEELMLREATLEELADTALVKYRYKNWFGAGVYQNDAVSSIYEPGSIMKSIIVAMALDAGEILPTDMYEDKGFVEVGDYTISNASDKCTGYHSFGHALNYSCNVGMIRIIQKVGKALSHKYFEDFGFTEKTGVELSGEVQGTLRPWETISRANFFTRSYGLGVSASPLQMASAYNVLANGGLYMKPQIIEEIVYPNGRVQKFKPEVKRRVIKESTSKTISQMLYDSVENGLAVKGKVEGYSLAGKTGTAQIFFRGRYQSGPGWTNASYAGYGPVEDPKFTILVKLERPKANVYGGNTSSVVFKEVAEYLFSYYGIPKKDDARGSAPSGGL